MNLNGKDVFLDATNKLTSVGQLPFECLNEKGRLIKSCWKPDRFGILKISKLKQNEWEERLDCLKNQIKYWIENPTDKFLEIVELFY